MNHDSCLAIPPELGLMSLADRLRGGDAVAGDELQSRLHGSLAPVVRLALRRGVGLPSLVRWVRQTFAALDGDRNSPPEQYAPQITSLLCSALVSGVPARPVSMDTVAGF